MRPVVYQAVYNAIHRSIEAELLPACRPYGLDAVVYNPIAGGLFNGKRTWSRPRAASATVPPTWPRSTTDVGIPAVVSRILSALSNGIER